MAQERELPAPQSIRMPRRPGRGSLRERLSWKHLALFAMAAVAEHYAEPTILLVIKELGSIFSPVLSGLGAAIGRGEVGAYVVTCLMVVAIVICLCVKMLVSRDKDGD